MTWGATGLGQGGPGSGSPVHMPLGFAVRPPMLTPGTNTAFAAPSLALRLVKINHPLDGRLRARSLRVVSAMPHGDAPPTVLHVFEMQVKHFAGT